MRSTRTIGRLALLAVLVLLALAAMTGTAPAHAQLEGSDPHAGDVLSAAPARVTLTFGEPVESARDAIPAFDDRLQRADPPAASPLPGGRDPDPAPPHPPLHHG